MQVEYQIAQLTRDRSHYGMETCMVVRAWSDEFASAWNCLALPAAVAAASWAAATSSRSSRTSPAKDASLLHTKHPSTSSFLEYENPIIACRQNCGRQPQHLDPQEDQ